MGTRADFYVGDGPDMEWLGSITWDGCEIPYDLENAKSETVYRANLDRFLASRDDATLPEMGWPWPWNDSRTTDVAYTFHGGQVLRWVYGPWRPATGNICDGCDDGCDACKDNDGPAPQFPDMSSRRQVAMGTRSGLISFVATPDGIKVI